MCIDNVTAYMRNIPIQSIHTEGNTWGQRLRLARNLTCEAGDSDTKRTLMQ